MRFTVALLFLASPALAVESGHSGTAHPRTGPAASDLALFACAAGCIWLTRRALRSRFDAAEDIADRD